MGCDGADHAVDVRMHILKNDIEPIETNTELRAAARLDRQLTGSDQGLGRHASRIEAIAPHVSLFNKDDGSSHLHGACSNRQTSRAGSDNAEIGPNAVRLLNRPSHGGGH